MYFNQMPMNFGLAPQQNPAQLLQKPVLGYNQGIGGLMPNQGLQGQPTTAPGLPGQANQNAQQNAAPQMQNFGGGTASTAGLGGKSITPLMPYNKNGVGQSMAEGGGVKKSDPGYMDYAATMARQAADSASYGAYKYGKAGADYAYDTLLGLAGYDTTPDYDRELAEERYMLREGKDKMPSAAEAGGIMGGLMSFGYAGGGVVQQNLAKGGVVAEGIAALQGRHPDPRSALAAYDEMFGPDATAELMRSYADGGVVSGPGSGVADLVPGSIDGREDVRIASGEYVIPAWAVAALGDGSTEAGAAILDDMVQRLRAEGSQRIMGTDPINPSEFLPA